MRRTLALLVASGCVADGGATPQPPPESLVRDGARPAIVRRADLEGDGTRELVVASLGEDRGSFGLATPYLEVFALRDGEWRRVFDASRESPGGEGLPPTMLQPPDEGFAVGQAIELVEPVDLAGDGASELVVAVSNVGATAGPLELWVISMSTDARFRAEYYSRTERGGNVAVEGDRVVLELGVYRKRDPGCCPSLLEERTIGYDPATEEIGVLERRRRRAEAA